MNNFLKHVFIFSSLSFLVTVNSGCSSSNVFKTEEAKMLSTNDKAFVIKTGGEKITGEKASWPTTLRGFKSGNIHLDEKRIPLADVVAWQDAKHYYVKFGSEWVTQVKRGKINLFYYNTIINNGSYNTVSNTFSSLARTEHHFVFQKDNGNLIEPSLEAISGLLIDNKEAYDKFLYLFRPGKTTFPVSLSRHASSLFEIIDIYNR